jgi:integrase
MRGSQTGRDRTVEALAANVREEMARLGYSQDTQRHYQATWSKLAAFALERESEGVSVELAEAFLVHSGVGSTGSGAPAASTQSHLRAAMRFLLEFQRHGCFQRRRSNSRLGLPGKLATTMSEYEHFCTHDLGIKHRTMRGRRRNVVRFLMHHASRESTDVRTIGVETVSDFLKSWCHLRPQTLALVVCDLRSFLRFLAIRGDVPAELVERVPKVRIRPDARIPDVWRAADVAALLAAVDRGSPVGKRDYAILLLAARLGLRAGDIRDLRLDDLRWDEARIEHTQSKTGRPVVLPLTEEVGEALITYLREGRPQTARREVFLRHLAPFEPFGRDNNLHSIITKYRCLAGIELPRACRKGLHALRHTVATRLLEAGVSLDAISGVMGHISPETTRLYTKVDLLALRSAALTLEEVEYA